MRRAGVALVLTAAGVVALARFKTEPPRTLNPESALRATPTPAPRDDGRTRTALGPAMTTPFSVIQVQATLTDGRLTAIKTVAMTGDGPHTDALNARAEPILREQALRAGSAAVDAVSGATTSSLVWLESLKGAIAKARGG